MKNTLLSFITVSLFLIFGTFNAQSQTYYQVTALTGSQLLGSTTVTVVGTGGNYGYYNFCSLIPGPYLPGNTSPGNFHFTFSTPVLSLRFTTHGMQNLEVNSIEINGAPYMLGPANNLIVCPTCTGTCQDPIGSFVGGNLVGIPGSGGQFTIENVPGGISTVRFSNNGMQSGTAFSIEFQEGLSVEADNNGPVCWGDTLKLFGVVAASPVTYSWTGPNGFTSTIQNPIIPNPTQANAGDYIFTVNGLYSDTTTVTLLPRPSAPVITFTEPICAGSTLNLSAVSDLPGASFSWTGPNGFTSNVANPSIFNAQDVHSGIYTVQANMDGCLSGFSQVTIEVKHSTASYLSKIICEGESYTFNGSVKTLTGKYVDTFINEANCDSFANLDLTVRPPLDLTITYNNSEQLCIGDTLTLTAGGAVNYIWANDNSGVDLGEGDKKFIVLMHPKNYYSIKGTDQNNCKGDQNIVLEAEPCCEVMLPNAFSPNNDGLNDFFGISNMGHLREFEMRVFDRFGQIVFVSFDQNYKWDGMINSKPANPGVYHYYITSKCDYGPDISLKGDLTLIR